MYSIHSSIDRRWVFEPPIDSVPTASAGTIEQLAEIVRESKLEGCVVESMPNGTFRPINDVELSRFLSVVNRR